MTASPPSVDTARLVRLDRDDLGEAAELLARAFDADPISRRLLPDPGERQRMGVCSARIQLDGALPFAHVFGVAENGTLRAVAIWLPPGTHAARVRPALHALWLLPPLLPSAVGVAPRLACTLLTAPTHVARLALTRRAAVARARGQPSWFLAVLGTDPAHQGRGFGGMLLTHVLHRADADRTSAWLETDSPANVALYERFGFTVDAHVPAGPTLPPWWLMVRPPASAADQPA